MADTIDFSAHYKSSDFGNIAVYVTRYATTEVYEGDYLLCDWDECDHMLSELLCWVEGDTSIVTDLDWVYVVMVGDDTERLVEVETLTLLTDDEPVCSCGQIGCWG